MMQFKTQQQEFLDRFTEEIIMILRGNFQEIEMQKEEQERINRSIEAEKLKQKFSEYLKKTPNQQSMQSAQFPHPAQPIKIIQRQQTWPQQQTQQTPAQQKKPVVTPLHIEIQSQQPPQQQKTNIVSGVASGASTAQGEINFGKILYLIRDPLITYIECQKENKEITIKKAGQTIRTQIRLTKEEISSIIKSFSEVTRIPLVEGMLIARKDNIEISAVISETSISSFIIKKYIIPPIQTANMPTQLHRPLMRF